MLLRSARAYDPQLLQAIRMFAAIGGHDSELDAGKVDKWKESATVKRLLPETIHAILSLHPQGPVERTGVAVLAMLDRLSEFTGICSHLQRLDHPDGHVDGNVDSSGRSTGGWFLTRHYEPPGIHPTGERDFISRGVLAKPGQIGKPHAKRHSRLRHPGLPERLDPLSISFKRATSAGLTKAILHVHEHFDALMAVALRKHSRRYHFASYVRNKRFFRRWAARIATSIAAPTDDLLSTAATAPSRPRSAHPSTTSALATSG